MTEPALWAVLLHNVPPTPGYLRAKVGRRLAELGAIPLKRAAYFLPWSEDASEDLHWLRREIVDAGGDAWVMRSGFLGGISDDEAREAFRAARANDYRLLSEAARALLDAVRDGTREGESLGPDRSRLEKRLAAIRGIDFFGAPGRDETEVLMDALEQRSNPEAKTPAADSRQSLKARRWMTRPGVRVDRMASAWLIRKFIDPAATFVFAASGGPAPADVVRFDMYEGDFTHDGDRCTFEVLLRRAGLRDRALTAIAEMVHDLDIKDDKHQRPETAGLAAMLEGIVARHSDDLTRLAEGALVFESLYQHFKKRGRR
jgi:hypothetical protein